MKKTVYAVIGLLLIMTACTNEPTQSLPPKITAGTAKQYSSSAEEVRDAEQPQGAKEALELFLEDMEDPEFTLRADNPESRSDSKLEVKVDEVLIEELASLFSDPEPQYDVALPKNLSENDGRLLTVSAENGDVFHRLSIYGLDAKNKEYPGGMLVSMENDDGQVYSYLYDKKTFSRLDDLLNKRTVGKTVSFQGNVTALRSRFDLARIHRDQGMETEEFLQFGNKILWRFSPQTDSYTQPSTVELLDTVSGQSLYSYTIPERVFYMERFSGEPGFDYRIVGESGIRYRSSVNGNQQTLWSLPSTVSLFAASAELSGTYDLRYGKLAYAGTDGLYIADADGQNRQPVAFYSALPAVMNQGEGSGLPYYLNDPRILLDGKRLVASIVTPGTGEKRLGFSLTDLETMETDYILGVTASGPRGVSYLGERAMAVRDEDRVTLIDTETGEKGALPVKVPSGGEYYTNDCKAFLLWESIPTSGDVPASSSVYTASSGNLADRTKKLFTTKGDTFYPVDITEEYLIGFCEDSRGMFPVAARYRTLPKKSPSFTPPATSSESDIWDLTSSSQPNSSSSSSSRSSSVRSQPDDNYDDEELLPPDITPDF